MSRGRVATRRGGGRARRRPSGALVFGVRGRRTRLQLSEINLRNYLGDKGLRFKLTKTDAELEAEGGEAVRPKMTLGPFQMFSPTCVRARARALAALPRLALARPSRRSLSLLASHRSRAAPAAKRTPRGHTHRSVPEPQRSPLCGARESVMANAPSHG
jgi:hypothetical protein